MDPFCGVWLCLANNQSAPRLLQAPMLHEPQALRAWQRTRQAPSPPRNPTRPKPTPSVLLIRLHVFPSTQQLHLDSKMSRFKSSGVQGHKPSTEILKIRYVGIQNFPDFSRIIRCIYCNFVNLLHKRQHPLSKHVNISTAKRVDFTLDGNLRLSLPSHQSRSSFAVSYKNHPF